MIFNYYQNLQVSNRQLMSSTIIFINFINHFYLAHHGAQFQNMARYTYIITKTPNNQRFCSCQFSSYHSVINLQEQTNTKIYKHDKYVHHQKPTSWCKNWRNRWPGHVDHESYHFSPSLAPLHELVYLSFVNT